MTPRPDHKVQGLALLRQRYPEQTRGLTDDGLAAAYSWWCEESRCEGWTPLGDYDADAFAAFAFVGAPTVAIRSTP